MPKKRKKTTRCLNCGHALAPVYNFCPYCGQENDDRNVSFGKLVKDFFSNYFSLDSKFARSLVPFFFKPGQLTLLFHQGKRAGYANPVRLYLLVSLLYFFALGLVADGEFNDGEDRKVISFGTGKDDVPDADFSSGFNSGFSSDSSDNLKFKALGLIENADSPAKSKPTTADTVLAPADTLLIDDTTSSLAAIDSVTEKVAPPANDSTAVTKGPRWVMPQKKWEQLSKLIQNEDLSEQEILDSLHMEQETWLSRLTARQMIKVNREGDGFFSYMIKNIPLMMFVLLPVFALILKILYIRRKWLYIKHLIHSIHLHTFAYFMYGIAFLINYYWATTDETVALVSVISFILVSTYAYISFLRVYKQKWFKTLVKFNLVGFIYFIALMIAFVAEVTISFLQF